MPFRPESLPLTPLPTPALLLPVTLALRWYLTIVTCYHVRHLATSRNAHPNRNPKVQHELERLKTEMAGLHEERATEVQELKAEVERWKTHSESQKDEGGKVTLTVTFILPLP